ncbi:MAG: sigma-54 interaction domain-containing protein [Candidatus Hydrogenedentales bacterium]
MNTSMEKVHARANSIRAPLHEHLVGESKILAETRDVLARLAQSKLTVLITGESGTGKDIAARMLHNLSPRFGRPFIKVNCPAIPESILESELFGYERGAFTGAGNSKPGRFELANKGTIFLDEIAETPYTVQAKLLQVLDGEPFIRIGGVAPIQTDVRIVAATNIKLEDAVQRGDMREDMYYRLNEVHVRMPALRERPEDLPLLAEHFNYHFCAKQGCEYREIDPAHVAEMQVQPWPGNVRELAARVRKYVATGNPELLLREGGPDVEPEITPARMGHVFDSKRAPARDLEAAQTRDTRTVEETPRKFVPLKEAVRKAVEATERTLIEDALRYTLWNRRKAAKLLKISYSSLLRRIEAYHIGKSDSETE